MKSRVFTIAVMTAFALGLYSLFLASVNAGKMHPADTAGFVRTATSIDSEKIALASGAFVQQDLVYVILYPADTVPGPKVEKTVQRAVRILSDAGTSAGVRLLDPQDPDYTMVVEQNGVDRFPSVLTVIKDRGIVLMTEEINEKNLLGAYHGMWGKTSSCDDAKSTIY